jgi:hypothetical protein
MINLDDAYINAAVIHGVWTHGTAAPYRIVVSFTDDDGVLYLEKEYETREEAQKAVGDLVAQIDEQTLPGLMRTLDYYLGTISRNLPR